MSNTANSSASKKSKTKTDKEQRYDNMLKQIDLKLDKADQKQANFDDADDSGFDTFGSSGAGAGLSIMDLVSNLQKNDKTSGQTAKLRSDVSELIQKKAFQEAPSVRVQEQMERKANYEIVKNDVKKWQGIIKKNREASHVDLTQKNDQKFRINSNQLNKESKSVLENKVEAKLKELNLFKEEDILNEEKEMLKKLNPDEAKRREKDLASHRNLMFYQELKNKRVSKIKSKLFHKIKNKREKRAHDKLMEGMESDPAAQLREIEELEKKRAQERISLRHKNKSKYVTNMMRFGNVKDSKQTVSDLTQLRREIMKKVNAEQKERLQGQLEEEDDEELYEGLNDEEFKEKMISELEEQLRGGDDEEDEESSKKKKKVTGFMKRILDQQNEKSKKEAEELLEKLKNTNNLDDFELSEGDEKNEDDMEEEENGEKKKDTNKRSKEPLQQGIAGRKKFHKEENGVVNTGAIEIEDYKKKINQKGTKNILNSYLDSHDEQPGIQIEAPTGSGKKSGGKTSQNNHLDRLEPKDILFSGDNDKTESKKESQKKEKESEKKKKALREEDKDDLVAGLNFDTLKQKYNKNNNTQFLGEQIDKFNEENKQDLYNELANFQVVGSNIYNEDFDEEKGKLYEDELPEEKKPLRGWGAWAGIGVKEKKVNPDLELKRKIAKIEELKRQRKDGKLDNVIVHEERNKNVKKYMIRDLPHSYKSAEQFDYVHSVPLGPEWNSLKNHQKLVKPKLITKAGEIINPIQAPKNRKTKNN